MLLRKWCKMNYQYGSIDQNIFDRTTSGIALGRNYRYYLSMIVYWCVKSHGIAICKDNCWWHLCSFTVYNNGYQMGEKFTIFRSMVFVLGISNGRYYHSLWTVLWLSISLASRQATLTQITSTFNAVGTRCSSGQFSVPYLSWDMEVEELPG